MMQPKLGHEDYYDTFSETYDETVARDVFYLADVSNTFHKYYAGDTGTVLDIGCGTGLLKEFLNGDFIYTGTDISQLMLERAADRGYIETIHKPIQETLDDIPDKSYDFVFALGCLLFVEEIEPTLEHLYRIARRAAFFDLAQITEEYKENSKVIAFNNFETAVPNAQEDYVIDGWFSASAGGLTVQTRVLYVPQN